MFKARKMLPAEMIRYGTKSTRAFCVEHESGRLTAVNLTWQEACAEARAQTGQAELEPA